MLMANLKAVLQRPKVSASYSRNAFDRSFSPKVHYQVGGLTPFMAEPVIAGSHFKLNRSIFQRTAAVNTAAFPKVDTHCEFFYVPLRLLWSYWNDFKLNIQDYNSSLMGTLASDGTLSPHAPTVVPNFNVSEILNEVAGWLQGNYTTLSPSTHFISPEQAVGAQRLLNFLDYGSVQNNTPWIDPSDSSATQPVSFTVNAFKLLAYQKVYYDHFRNTAYESNDPSAYNADCFTRDGSFNAKVLTKLLTYRYVNYRKDYFQSIYPALNYVIASPNGLNWSIPDSVMYSLTQPTGAQTSYPIAPSNLNNGQTAVNWPSTNVTSYSAFSVQQIRAAFALDKLLRASAYAPKHVKDQFEARFGVKGVESGNESVRIGAFMNDIIFQEVTNMADTNNNLGDIGGKGVGYDGMKQDIEFTAKEDGLVLGLIYSIPRSSYDSRGIANWNAKDSREDFFIPEFMDLGMQPVYHYEGSFSVTDLTQNNNIYGYSDRYREYKIGIDKNYGLFNSGYALSDFVAHTNQGRLAIVGAGNGVGYSFFKVAPTDLDSVFVQNTSTYNWETDKFITYLDVKFICNQNMSVHGQPRLGGIG